MDSVLTPIPFNDRRAPLVAKVERDAEIMYKNARYIIALNEMGHVIEQRFNRRIDDEVVDCLAVFAPFTYKDVRFERVLVLEIGFRRFVPYAQTEHKLGASTRRGPVIRLRKGEERRAHLKVNKKKGKMAYVIKSRVPVAFLTEDMLFDIMPVLTSGIQECVDSIVQTWTNTPQTVRWVKAGSKARSFWIKHEMERSISVRIPKTANLLCATACFAGLQWRAETENHIDVSAKAIRNMLKPFTLQGRRRGKDSNGCYSDDYVRKSSTFHWVAHRLKEKIERGYSSEMVDILLDFVGLPESAPRKLLEQIWKVYKVPQPKKDPLLQKYQNEYEEMKDLLLERWLIRNHQNLRLEKKKKKWQKERESRRPYAPHASNSEAFSVYASKEAHNQMATAYLEKRVTDIAANDSLSSQLSDPKEIIAPENDDDIPWDTAPANKTGTDDEPPF